MRGLLFVALSSTLAVAAPARAQQPAQPAAAPAAATATAVAEPVNGSGESMPSANGGVLPPEYQIGVGDVLVIAFWRERDLSAEVTVRPDGRITLPLLNDIYVAGMTTAALRDKLAEDARRFVTEPTPSVIVRRVN